MTQDGEIIPNAFCSDSNVSRFGSAGCDLVCFQDDGGERDGCDHADGAHGGGPALAGGSDDAAVARRLLALALILACWR